jgi:3-hydroxymyristoyl/3-hydroxydecanoyl-(acyl carrier protein) dehydratase
MTCSLRVSLERRPFIKLHDLKSAISGVLFSREFFNERLFYIIQRHDGVLIKLVESVDLARKMDPVEEGDQLTIEFKGWSESPGGFAMQLAEVKVG